MTTAAPPNGNEARFERPRRAFVPSAALLSGDSGEPAIPSQRKAVEEFLAAEAAKRAAETKLAIDALRAATFTPTSSRESSPVVKGESPEKFCTLGWAHKLLTLPKHSIMLKMPIGNTPEGGGVFSKDSVKIIGRKII